MTKRMMLALAMSVAVGVPPANAQTGTKAHKKTRVKESETQTEMRELRESQIKLQAEIDDLKRMLMDRDAKLTGAAQVVQETQAKADAANAKADEASSSLAQEDNKVKEIQGQINDQTVATNAAVKTVSDAQVKLAATVESPSTLHYKGVTITPGGFAAAETVVRTRSLNSDINTPFNSTIYQNNPQAYTSEFSATGRQSRMAVLINAPTKFGSMGAYYEMDFLSAGVTSNANQTNSYTLRQREAWAKIATNSGFQLTGGQMWSLVTEVKKGINPVPGGENLPNTIDPQYHVGFSFTRQYALRFAQSFGPHNNIAVALEEPQLVLAGTTNAPFNYFFGAAGATGGLLNNGGNTAQQNYTNNVAPDVIVKYTGDAKYGHFEVGGIARFFRDRYYPTLAFSTTAYTAIPAGTGTNSTATGGGFFANARVPVTRYLDVGVHLLQGTGTGRYGTSNLGDVTVKPTGVLEPLRNSQGLVSLETHPTRKLDFFGYAGGEYLQRTVYTAFTAAAPTVPVYVGYAPIQGENDSACFAEATAATTNNGVAPAASTCTGHTRAVIEGTAGFIYRIYNSPTAGRFQFSAVYSYLTREAWTGLDTHTTTGVGNPKATNNMIFTGFRYYIP